MTALRVWAPDSAHVAADINGDRIAMRETNGGWWELEGVDVAHGTDYAFVLDDGSPRPDPRSRWQPNGVHEPSRVYDHELFEWHDQAWHGRPLAGSVLYEAHIGTFTEKGTFDAAIEHLDHLLDLGIDFVEILPVASWDGDAGWGYDGVALYAVHEPYGGPDGLKRFVDACHERGLGVILDVVYNHVGPSGNYLSEFGAYLTDAHHTPWGDAINLDRRGSDEVRGWIVDNALGWLSDFHVDGLRLDAIHALHDSRAVHILEELVHAVRGLSGQLGREKFLISESDLNNPRVITPIEAGGLGTDAQWTDDVHHALHAVLTGERHGYYVDFGSLETLATTLQSAFWHVDTWSTFRGRHHGRPVDRSETPGHRFVTYLQNHDQIGNRAIGDRLSQVLSIGQLKIAAALLMTSAFTPQLFMGEEWAASTPWQFFTSFTDADLGRAVSAGRKAEFADFGWSADGIPDPQDPATVEASTLRWHELNDSPHADMLAWHKQLIALRRSEPALIDGRLDLVTCDWDRDKEQWFVLRRQQIVVVCNFSGERIEVPVAGTPRQVLTASASGFVYRDGVVELDGESVVIAMLQA